MKEEIVVISGVSCSGKTTLKDHLVSSHNFKSLTNFTTRAPRNDKELDDYVFVDEHLYLDKLKKGHFLEFMYNYGNFYSVGGVIEGGKNVVVVDPVGREQIRKWGALNGVKVRCFFLDIPQSVQEERLKKRGSSEEGIEKRKTDFSWFAPGQGDTLLSGEWDLCTLAKIIDGGTE